MLGGWKLKCADWLTRTANSATCRQCSEAKQIMTKIFRVLYVYTANHSYCKTVQLVTWWWSVLVVRSLLIQRTECYNQLWQKFAIYWCNLLRSLVNSVLILTINAFNSLINRNWILLYVKNFDRFHSRKDCFNIACVFQQNITVKFIIFLILTYGSEICVQCVYNV